MQTSCRSGQNERREENKEREPEGRGKVREEEEQEKIEGGGWRKRQGGEAVKLDEGQC